MNAILHPHKDSDEQKTYIHFSSQCHIGFFSWYASITDWSYATILVLVDINLVTVGSLTLISVPYSLKFMWAPVLDSITFGFDCARKVWILLCQFLISMLLVCMSFLSPVENTISIVIIAFLVALSSATLDIAVDAYRQVSTLEEIRGIVVSGYNIAYRLAMLVTGGLALILADSLGWKITYQIMSTLMFITFIMTLCITSVPNNTVKSISGNFIHVMKILRNSNAIVRLCIFFVLYKIADAFILVFVSPFLLQGMGLSLSYVGWVLKVFGTVATFLGAGLVGFFVDRFTLIKSMLVFSIAQSISMLLYIILAIYQIKSW